MTFTYRKSGWEYASAKSTQRLFSAVYYPESGCVSCHCSASTRRNKCYSSIDSRLSEGCQILFLSLYCDFINLNSKLAKWTRTDSVRVTSNWRSSCVVYELILSKQLRVLMLIFWHNAKGTRVRILISQFFFLITGNYKPRNENPCLRRRLRGYGEFEKDVENV
jgi:hypothetical protein